MNIPSTYLQKKVNLEDVLARYGNFENCDKEFIEDWERLRAKMISTDELWRFEPPPGAIQIWGIALVRSGEVVATLVDSVD